MTMTKTKTMTGKIRYKISPLVRISEKYHWTPQLPPKLCKLHIVCAFFLGFKVDMYIVYCSTNLYHHSLFSVIIFSLFSSQHSGLKQTLLQTKKRALKKPNQKPTERA